VIVLAEAEATLQVIWSLEKKTVFYITMSLY